MRFFGMLPLVSALLSIGFMVPVFNEYLQTGLVSRFPARIVCVFAVLAAMVALFAGILLDNITWKNRQDFEMQMQRVSAERKQPRD